jgi:DNA-binding transcriptional MocR family regulator
MPDDDQLLAVAADHDLLIGSLRYCFQGTDPTPGFIVGFGGLPTGRVEAACHALRAALRHAQQVSCP